jgi:hypothetical protein
VEQAERRRAGVDYTNQFRPKLSTKCQIAVDKIEIGENGKNAKMSENVEKRPKRR